MITTNKLRLSIVLLHIFCDPFQFKFRGELNNPPFLATPINNFRHIYCELPLQKK